jgi:SAM-dependent methyltransferase
MTNQPLKASLQASYTLQAQARDASPMQTWKLEERLSFLEMLQQEGRRSLLEIGAGAGRDSRFLQDQGLKVTSVDLTPEMARLCRQKGLAACIMDAGALGFAAHSFEAVYALNSLLHLPKVELPGVLRQSATLLKPAGLFYLGVFGGEDFEGIWEQDTYVPQRFYAFYPDERLQQIVSDVFDILSFKRIIVAKVSPFYFQSLILRKQK